MRKQSLFAGVAAGVVAALLAGATAQAQDTTASWKGAPQFKDGDMTFKVRGRTYIDYVFQDVDRDTGADFSASNSRIRTARLGVEGTWADQWAYKAEVNFTGGSASWEDLVLEYKAGDQLSLMVGNFKSVSLENLTSSRYTTFMERGAFNDFIDGGRAATLAAKANGANWTLAAGVHGDSINDADVAGDETRAVFARGAFAPVLNETTAVHLGAWARSHDSGGDSPLPYRVRNNTNYGERYTDTGSSLAGTSDTDTQLGLEGAVVHGPFSIQGEYARVDADLRGGGEAEGRGYYVFASFFPTGESRRYNGKKGEFDRIRIANPVTDGGWGAVELGLRYDSVDLSDFAGVPTAGEYSAITAGATWHPFPYVRFMANYTDADNDAQTAAADVDVKTFQLRAQFDF